MKRKLMVLLITTAALIPAAVKAQEYGIPQNLLIEQFSQSSTDSQIVIRVRKAGDHSNLCGSEIRRAGALPGDGFDFPRPGGTSNRYDFPQPGRSNYFQLPTGTRNPDIIGCVDRARNILFVNIFKTAEQPSAKSEPAPYNPYNKPPYFNRAQ
ncbi:hypothetical protein [Leptolyngbya sp. FACHB-17]|uniref:hypothetical protein n=1 Tax=unclassified Leptolyngbya TaxID=2650499 RepID=UPI0016809DE3|nr:hypothetical protein [Leptolyngbya sp. FACHB-17]MBD2081533.1 hypothetical protein [Leptolyngbya sp. FACHB-17]